MVATSHAGGFQTVDKCTSAGRAGHTVVADMDGTLLRGRSAFPYYALVAFDVGGVLRLTLLLLAAPLAGALYYLVSESAGIRVLVFAAMTGARVSDVESAARAVLPKFYATDVHPEAWRVFSACGRRCVITANPRIMVETFLKEYLGADVVIGTEIEAYGGRATGFVRHPGILVGVEKAAALMKAFGEVSPEIGLGDRKTDFPFMRLCQEAYIVPANPKPEAVPGNKLRKLVIFHDGRLVQAPSPLHAILIVLWFPAGLALAFLRIAVGNVLPLRYVSLGLRVLGVRIIVKGTPPPAVRSSGNDQSGVLFVCAHRTLMDPVFLSLSIRRPVSALTYSVSRLTEIISPIRTFRLSRDRDRDAAMIRRLLQEGDLIICPEGTTCREPFLLRFSALFAELSDRLVPVAMESKTSMFHGTTARGRKWMDAIYFFMNPSPAYEVTFLDELPSELTCGAGGRPRQEVANYVQALIATTLGYQCTTLTRKDKYMAMAGNEGVVSEKKSKLVKGSRVGDELLKALY